MSYNLLPTSSLWQFKLSRKFDGKLTSTGTVICHLYSSLYHFSQGQHKSCESERKISNKKKILCESQIWGNPKKKVPQWGGHRLITNPPLTKSCIIAQSNLITVITELEIWCTLVLAVTYSHIAVAVGGKHGHTVCVRTCAWRGGGCGTNRDLPTSSLSKWHHSR